MQVGLLWQHDIHSRRRQAAPILVHLTHVTFIIISRPLAHSHPTKYPPFRVGTGGYFLTHPRARCASAGRQQFQSVLSNHGLRRPMQRGRQRQKHAASSRLESCFFSHRSSRKSQHQLGPIITRNRQNRCCMTSLPKRTRKFCNAFFQSADTIQLDPPRGSSNIPTD